MPAPSGSALSIQAAALEAPSNHQLRSQLAAVGIRPLQMGKDPVGRWLCSSTKQRAMAWIGTASFLLCITRLSQVQLHRPLPDPRGQPGVFSPSSVLAVLRGRRAVCGDVSSLDKSSRVNLLRLMFSRQRFYFWVETFPSARSSLNQNSAQPWPCGNQRKLLQLERNGGVCSVAGLRVGDALLSAQGPSPSAPAGCGLRGGDRGEATKSPCSLLTHPSAQTSG